MKNKSEILILAAATLLSRLPFLGAGYGTDPDAWRLVSASQKIAQSGEYFISREPAHPIQEYLCALCVNGGPWLINGLTAFFSILAVVFFAMALNRWKIKNSLYAGLALAFAPIIYVNSVNAMDYIWALAFLMISLFCLATRRYLWAGILLGLAAGCRLTSLAMLIPYVIIISATEKSRKPSREKQSITQFAVSTIIVSLITYIPVVIKYGISFLTFYEGAPDGYRDVMRLASVGVWGWTGTIGIGVIIILLAFFPVLIRRIPETYEQKNIRLIRPLVIAIGIIVAGFARLPAESGYLIPIIPWLILLAAMFFRKRIMIVIVALFILASFVSIGPGTGGLNFGEGPVLASHMARTRGMAFVEKIFASEDQMDDKSVVVTAWWEPYLRVMHHPKTNKDIEYVYHVDDARLREWLDKGYTIYHLSYVEGYNLDNYGVDLTKVSHRLDVEY